MAPCAPAGVVRPVRVDQGSQVEVGEVVGVQRQEHLFPVDPIPVGAQRAGAAEQFGLEDGQDRGRRGPRGHVVAHHAGQMVEDVRLALPDRSRIASIGGVSFDDSGLRYGTLMDVPEIRARAVAALSREKIA